MQTNQQAKPDAARRIPDSQRIAQMIEPDVATEAREVLAGLHHRGRSRVVPRSTRSIAGRDLYGVGLVEAPAQPVLGAQGKMRRKLVPGAGRGIVDELPKLVLEVPFLLDPQVERDTDRAEALREQDLLLELELIVKLGDLSVEPDAERPAGLLRELVTHAL